jgi:hypothetical protein
MSVSVACASAPSREHDQSVFAGSILEQLPAAALAALAGAARRGRAAALAAVPADRVLFPCSGIIAIRAAGHGVEVGSIGREGGMCVRVDPGFGLVAYVPTTYVSIDMLAFARLTAQYREIAALRQACNGWLLAQAQQIAICNTMHGMRARISRWLLRTADLLGTDRNLPFSQHTIATATGFERTSTCQALGQLDGVRYRRCSISIDREKLRQTACDCCETFSSAHWPRIAEGVCDA